MSQGTNGHKMNVFIHFRDYEDRINHEEVAIFLEIPTTKGG